jgi:hypothetical protein
MGLVGPGTHSGGNSFSLLSFGNGLSERETVLIEDASSLFSLCIMLDEHKAEFGKDRSLSTKIAPDDGFSSLPLLGTGLLDGVPGVSRDTFLRLVFGLAVRYRRTSTGWGHDWLKPELLIIGF